MWEWKKYPNQTLAEYLDTASYRHESVEYSAYPTKSAVSKEKALLKQMVRVGIAEAVVPRV